MEKAREDDRMESTATEGLKSKRLHATTQARWRPSPAKPFQSENRSSREIGKIPVSDGATGGRPFRKRAHSLASARNPFAANGHVMSSSVLRQDERGENKTRTELGAWTTSRADVERWLLEGLTPGVGGLLTVLVGFAWAGLTFI